MANENPEGDLGNGPLPQLQSGLTAEQLAAQEPQQANGLGMSDWYDGETDITNPNIQSWNHHHPRPQGR